MEQALKLYVWEDVFAGYWPGMAVAVAHNIREARTIAARTYGGDVRILTENAMRELTAVKPKVIKLDGKTRAQAWSVSGGD